MEIIYRIMTFPPKRSHRLDLHCYLLIFLFIANFISTMLYTYPAVAKLLCIKLYLYLISRNKLNLGSKIAFFQTRFFCNSNLERSIRYQVFIMLVRFLFSYSCTTVFKLWLLKQCQSYFCPLLTSGVIQERQGNGTNHIELQSWKTD